MLHHNMALKACELRVLNDTDLVGNACKRKELNADAISLNHCDEIIEDEKIQGAVHVATILAWEARFSVAVYFFYLISNSVHVFTKGVLVYLF